MRDGRHHKEAGLQPKVEPTKSGGKPTRRRELSNGAPSVLEAEIGPVASIVEHQR
jgi:hypothetical protein